MIFKSKRFLIATYSIFSLAWQTKPSLFIATIVLEISRGSFLVISAYFTKRIFDLLSSANQKGSYSSFVSDLVPFIIGYILIAFFGDFCNILYSIVSADFTRALQIKTQEIVYRKLNQLEGLAHLENPAFHTTIRLAKEGASTGPLLIVNIVTGFVRSSTILISFLGALLVFSIPLSLIVFGVSLLQLLIKLRLGSKRLELIVENDFGERKAGYLSDVISSTRFAKEVKMFGLGEYFLDKILSILQTIQLSQRKLQLHEAGAQSIVSIFDHIISGTAFLFVIIQTAQQIISLGDVTLYLAALGNVQGGLLGIVAALSTLSENTLMFEHFIALQKISNPISAIPPIYLPTALENIIELRNVSFRYSNQSDWVLRNVNLIIPKGTSVAIVGSNGSGKSTLVKLITRMYDPTEGQILWDGIDIRHFEPEAFRRNLSVVFQDFCRFDLSVNENISLGNIELIKQQDQVEKAAIRAGIHERIKSLPKGYETILSLWLTEDNEGVDFSGGQWQKLAIARMFFREADFLLLDEPTASLDAKAESEIYRQFVSMVRGRTSLLISHRFSTVRSADMIAVMENGKITEFDSHDNLIAKGGTYAQLFEFQRKQYQMDLGDLLVADQT